MEKPENWLSSAQGIIAASPQQAAQDAVRIARHWHADRALLERAARRSDPARLFDTAMGAFNRMLQP